MKPSQAKRRQYEAALTRTVGRWVSLLGLALAVCGCDGALVSTGGETHFLIACSDETGCRDGMSCICGACTRSCSEPSECPGFPAVECSEPSAADACSVAPSEAVCEVRCTTDVDCAGVSQYHYCQDGACRARPSEQVAGDAGGSADANQEPLAATAPCSSDGTEANQVVVLGDSFFGATHQITSYLEEMARLNDVIAEDESYQDVSSIYANALALGGNGIAAQFSTARAEADVRVVIMNGGGADLLVGGCAAPTADCPVLQDASLAAAELLAHMATEGVQHVVYAFYPDPLDPDLKARMDAFRPLMEDVCENSPVPCHWLDLRETFAGHHDQYVQPDGRNPTAEGAQATASAIWQLLQAQCIAQ